MAIRIVRLGTPRVAGEGLRLGTVRRPPRGVPKAEFARRDFYDVWLPELSPSAPVVSSATSEPWTPARWRRFERTYRREMATPAARHLIELLVASHCHRSLLAELLADAGAKMWG